MKIVILINTALFVLQLRRNLAVIGKTPGIPTLETVLEQWKVFCEKPPKGFEKFFEPAGKRSKAPEANEAKKESAAKDAPPNKPPAGEPPRTTPPPGSTQRPSSSSSSNWSFGLFSGGSG